MYLTNWTNVADVEEGVKLATTAAENAAPREARKRIRLLEHEDEGSAPGAAYLFQAKSSACLSDSAVTCRVLKTARRFCCGAGHPVISEFVSACRRCQ